MNFSLVNFLSLLRTTTPHPERGALLCQFAGKLERSTALRFVVLGEFVLAATVVHAQVTTILVTNTAAMAGQASYNFGGANQVSLVWSASSASNFGFYSIYRSTNSGGSYSLIASNLESAAFTNTNVTAGVTYYYVVTAMDWVGYESAYSTQRSAVPSAPLPTTPTNRNFSISNNTLVLNWPSNYTGWLLQVQTNTLAQGLGTNWTTVSGSQSNSLFLTPINSTNPAVFCRLKLP